MRARLMAMLLLPFLLASCVLSPGKFTSTLTINADRSFTFSYVGEVIALDTQNLADLANLKPGAATDPKPASDAAKKAAARAEAERRNRAIAAALSREAGYRKVSYLGAGKFSIDYAVKGTLTHSFHWPLNLDAELIFPFVSIELRQGGVVRMQAPAFGAGGSKGLPGLAEAGASLPDTSGQLDGVFTLDTDAEIVSQNEVGGVQRTAGGRQQIVWRATPALKQAPLAVLKLAAPAP